MNGAKRCITRTIVTVNTRQKYRHLSRTHRVYIVVAGANPAEMLHNGRRRASRNVEAQHRRTCALCAHILAVGSQLATFEFSLAPCSCCDLSKTCCVRRVPVLIPCRGQKVEMVKLEIDAVEDACDANARC